MHLFLIRFLVSILQKKTVWSSETRDFVLYFQGGHYPFVNVFRKMATRHDQLLKIRDLCLLFQTVTGFSAAAGTTGNDTVGHWTIPRWLVYPYIYKLLEHSV